MASTRNLSKKSNLVFVAFVIITFLPFLLADGQLNCDFHESINISSGGQYQNDIYIHNGVNYGPDQYGMVDYDIIRGKEVPVTPHIRGCICAIKPCVRICCNPEKSKKCPTDYEGHVKDVETGEITFVEDLSEQFKFTYLPLACEKYSNKPHRDSEENYTITTDGFLDFHGAIKDRSTYCIAHDGNHTHAFLCFDDEPPLESKFKIYPFGMLLSVPCLIATFLVYGLVTELRNLPGKILMSYVLCLTIAYSSMSIVFLKTNDFANHWMCPLMGYVVYIAFVSSFFWLNILCFDLWWTFRGATHVARNSEQRKFFYYSMYGWGCPLLILFWTYYADQWDFVPPKFKPLVGEQNCFLRQDKLVLFLYMYLLMVLQLLFNITLFICTALQIRKVLRETANAISKGDSRRFNRMEADKDRFGIYLRIFILMGVTWFFEFISFVVDAPEEWSYFTDILNCLHGFFIFSQFVLKPRVKALIVKRYREFMGLQTPQSDNMRSSSQTTNSSSGCSRQRSITKANQLLLKNVKCPDTVEDGDESKEGTKEDRD